LRVEEVTAAGTTGRDVRHFVYVAAVVFGLAIALRFWALDFGLPHLLTRPDEKLLLDKTLLPARGEFNIRWATYPSAYVYLHWLWGEACLALQRVLGDPSALEYASTFSGDPARLLLIGRSLSAAAGAITVLALMGLALSTLGPRVALAAGFLLATNFLHVRDSHAMKPDALVTLGAVASLAAMQPLARRATLRSAALAGAVIGAAVAMKYTAVLLLPSLYVAAVMGSTRRDWRRLFPGPAFAGIGCAALVFAATSPYLLFDADSLKQFEVGLQLLFAWLPGGSSALASDVRATTGFFERLHYYVSFSLCHGAGPLATLLALPALVWGFASRRPVAVLAALYASVHLVVVSTGGAPFGRFMSPIIPVLALLEAGAIAAALERIAPRRAPLWLALAVALLAAEPLASGVAHNRIASRTDTRELATAWLDENLPAGTRLAIHGQVGWKWGMPRVPPGAVAVPAGVGAASLSEAGVEILVTHDHPLSFSTVDGAALAALGPRLRLLAEFDPFGERGADAVFEPYDAYYIPIHGFAGVERPGPHIRIHAFE